MSYLSIFDSARTSVIEPGLFSMRSRKSMWNVGLHPRDDYLRNAAAAAAVVGSSGIAFAAAAAVAGPA